MSERLSPQYRAYIQSDRWRKGWRRQATLAMLLGQDCICPLLPATQADHLTYRNLEHELPLRDLVPLNRHTHQLVTMLRDVLRAVLGRKTGNFLMAWFLRGCVLFWWGLAIAGFLRIYLWVAR
jgi:hypothetical protein